MARAQQIIQRLALNQPFFTLLVGLPASGKSTFTKLAQESLSIVVVSTDNMIDEWAAAHGMTYSEAWDKCPMKEFNRRFQEEIELALIEEKNIFIDRTNMAAKTRKSFLNKVNEYGLEDGKAWTKFAIKFDIPDKLLQERLDARAAATGKYIPPGVIKQMTAAYMPPTKSEGLDIIIDLAQ